MKIAVISPEPVGGVMSGIGIRMASLAGVLDRRIDTIFLAPEGSDIGAWRGGPEIRLYRKERIGRAVDDADCALVQGEAANYLLSQRSDLFVVVDLYDPFAVEALAYGEDAHMFARSSLDLQIRRGDLLLCASPEQKLFYSGVIYQAGLLNPALYGVDPSLDLVLLEIPFGVPEDPPPAGAAGYLRERIQAPKDEPILFFGGLYDWYDGESLAALWRETVKRTPAHLVVCRHPRSDTTPQEQFRRFVHHAETMGLKDRSIHVIDWIPYDDRVAAYGDAACALSIHPDTYETRLSFRTRVLDFLWAGLPVISSPGGGLQRVVGDLPGIIFLEDTSPSRAALVVAEELDRGITDERRIAVSRAIRNRLSWERVSRPLTDRLAAMEGMRPHERPSFWRKLFS